MYGSYTDPNPSAAYYDFSYLLTAVEGEVTAVRCSTTYITRDNVTEATEDCDQCSGREKRQTGEEEDILTVYITIEGASDMENEFSVNSGVGAAFGEKYSFFLLMLFMRNTSLPECSDGFSCGENEELVVENGSCSCGCVSGYQRGGEECISTCGVCDALLWSTVKF